MKVGRHQFFLLSSMFHFILFFAVFPSIVEAKKCVTAGGCAPVKTYDFYKFDIGQRTTKECDDDNDACTIFWCVVDRQKVMVGFGCYSDFAKVCGKLAMYSTTEVKEMTKLEAEGRNTNVRVFLCKSDDEKCPSQMYQHYIDTDKYYFSKQLLEDADMSYDQSCSYPLAPNNHQSSNAKKQVNEDAGGSNGPSRPNASHALKQMNGFQVFAMILLGFILAQFW